MPTVMPTVMWSDGGHPLRSIKLLAGEELHLVVRRASHPIALAAAPGPGEILSLHIPTGTGERTISDIAITASMAPASVAAFDDNEAIDAD